MEWFLYSRGILETRAPIRSQLMMTNCRQFQIVVGEKKRGKPPLCKCKGKRRGKAKRKGKGPKSHWKGQRHSKARSQAKQRKEVVVAARGCLCCWFPLLLICHVENRLPRELFISRLCKWLFYSFYMEEAILPSRLVPVPPLSCSEPSPPDGACFWVGIRGLP